MITVGQEPENGFRADRHFEEENMDALIKMLECREQEITAPEEDGYGIAWHDTGNGRALHIINYSYDSDSHRIKESAGTLFPSGKNVEAGMCQYFPGKSTVGGFIQTADTGSKKCRNLYNYLNSWMYKK